MAARENILARIRARQGKSSTPAASEREAVRAHITARLQNARPRTEWEPVTRFREQARRLSSTVEEIGSMDDVPATVARYLKMNGLPSSAVCWQQLAGLDWRAADMVVEARAGRDSDLVGITGAFCAIAETGTLVTVSGPATPATVSLLPETHIAIVSSSCIVRGMEEAWQLVRDELGRPARAVSFISGPSRTADIEQTVTLGAHGPYRVHIVIVAAPQ